MQISIRQGLLRYDTQQSPPILTPTAQSYASVDLNVVGAPIVIAFSHYDANYIVEENNTIIGAWGSGAIGSVNGPLTQGQTQYLFWDIDLATGALTRGWTAVPWITTSDEPLNPPNDLHWFDLVNTRMRVWRAGVGSNPGYWQDRIRVFAGIYNQNATITNYLPGSQVGISGGPYNAGNLLLGTNNAPLRQSDGTFATTATQLIIQQTSGQNVQFDAAMIFGEAAEEIPAFYLVSFIAGNGIMLARNSNYQLFATGLVVENLNAGDVGQVVNNGLITNDQWTFSTSQVGSPVFLGQTGQLVFTPPVAGVVQQVGTIYSPTAIYLNIFPPVRQQWISNLVPAVGAPIILDTDGVLSELNDGGIINAGGVNGATFTVGGKGLLFSDGTSTGGSSSGALTLQQVYNNSPVLSSTGATTIVLNSGQDLMFQGPNGSDFVRISSTTGQVTISGDLVVEGESTVVESTTIQSDHWLIQPASSTTSALVIQPAVGVVPIVDLVTIRSSFGTAPVFRIDMTGNVIASQNLTVGGLINGINIVTLNDELQSHLAGDVGYRHTASQVDITPIDSLPGATNVQQALQALALQTGNSNTTGPVQGMSFSMPTPTQTWIITHNFSTFRAVVTVYDLNYEQIIPDEVAVIDSDTIQVSFAAPLAGSAMVLLF